MDLRGVMPLTAARIDRMREQLGRDVVNEMLRKAMAGQPRCFFAAENHRTFGTQDTVVTHSCYWDESERFYRSEPRWMIEAAEFAATIGIEIEIKNMQDFDEARERAELLKKILREAKYA